MGILDIFRPKWKNSNATKRIEAIQELTDESILTKIAFEDENMLVSIDAVTKITAQDALIKIALEHKYCDVRISAIQKITDKDSLIKIALEDEVYDAREKAIQKITDQDALTKIALEDNSEGSGEIAAEKITDKDLLTKIVLECKDGVIREIAIQKITAQDALIKIALECKDGFIREKAVQKITDQDSLTKIALECKDSMFIRKIAVQKITNQNSLTKIALGDEDWHVRAVATEKITDQDTLIKIALEDEDIRVRDVAVKIDDSKIDALVEKEIKVDFSNGTYLMSLGKSLSDKLDLEKEIDSLLSIYPNNSDLLFAKSELQYASIRQKEGKETRMKLLNINQDHFDANLRENYPDNWTNLFGFPSYSERLNNLPETIYKIWKHNNAMVQIVRNKLNLSLALLSQAPDVDFPSDCKVVDYMWKPTWVETPYGGIFVHYLMVKFDDGFVLKREGTINPFPSAPISQKDLLIQRFYNCQSIFLTWVNERKVHLNKKYFLTDKHKMDLKKIVQKINSNKTLSDFDVQSAQNWYWNNVSLDDIKFE